MNVEVTKLPESRVTLTIELTPQEVNQALDRTYKQLVQRVNIPGFRKGKAPRSVVERLVGHEFFLHEATDEAVRWGYRRAVDQSDLTPIDEAEIDGGEHEHVVPDEPFHFEARVTVKPVVQLPDIHTIQVDREQIDVTDDDVVALLEELQRRNVTLEPVVRPAQNGDVVTMNIVAKAGGDEVLNRENFDYEVHTEDRAGEEPIPGLSRELDGVNRGDIKEASLPMPSTYPNEELAGKTLFLRMVVKEIKRQLLPELNDEFAESVSEFTTLDELRETLSQNLTVERRQEADEQLVSRAVNEVVQRSFVEIPPILINEEIDRSLDEMRRLFEGQHLTLESYLEAVGKAEADLRNEMAEDAANSVKTSLVLGAVADRENIEVSTREVDTALDEVLRTAQMPQQERRRLRSSTGVRSNIRNRLRRQRAIQKLVEIVSGGEEVSPEATEAVTDQTAAVAQDTEETVAVEIGG